MNNYFFILSTIQKIIPLCILISINYLNNSYCYRFILLLLIISIIYVYGGVPHQVLNTGVLLAEAVNVGGARWNSSFVQPVCYCPGTVVSPIRRNRASMEYINWTPIPFRECSVAGCQVASSTAVHARAHARQHEPGSGSASFSCRLCPRVYLKEGFLGTTSLRLITLLRRVSLKEPAPLVGGPMDGPLVAT